MHYYPLIPSDIRNRNGIPLFTFLPFMGWCTWRVDLLLPASFSGWRTSLHIEFWFWLFNVVFSCGSRSVLLLFVSNYALSFLRLTMAYVGTVFLFHSVPFLIVSNSWSYVFLLLLLFFQRSIFWSLGMRLAFLKYKEIIFYPKLVSPFLSHSVLFMLSM